MVVFTINKLLNVNRCHTLYQAYFLRQGKAPFDACPDIR